MGITGSATCSVARGGGEVGSTGRLFQGGAVSVESW